MRFTPVLTGEQACSFSIHVDRMTLDRVTLGEFKS